MAQEPSGLDRLNGKISAITTEGEGSIKYLAEKYDVNHSLDQQELEIAVAYEVARKANCSLADATEKYDVEVAKLEGTEAHGEKAVMQFAASKISEHMEVERAKPLVLLVNYNAGSDESPTTAPHWVPITINREGDKVSIDIINSESTWNNKEIKELVESVVAEAVVSDLEVEVTSHDRHVQHANACGLSAAQAVGIAVNAIETRKELGEAAGNTVSKAIEQALHNHPDEIEMTVHDGREALVTAQGKRTFKVIEHLTGLEPAQRVRALTGLASTLEESPRITKQAPAALAAAPDATTKPITKSSKPLLDQEKVQSEAAKFLKMAAEIQEMASRAEPAPPAGGAESSSDLEVQVQSDLKVTTQADLERALQDLKSKSPDLYEAVLKYETIEGTTLKTRLEQADIALPIQARVSFAEPDAPGVTQEEPGADLAAEEVLLPKRKAEVRLNLYKHLDILSVDDHDLATSGQAQTFAISSAAILKGKGPESIARDRSGDLVVTYESQSLMQTAVRKSDIFQKIDSDDDLEEAINATRFLIPKDNVEDLEQELKENPTLLAMKLITQAEDGKGIDDFEDSLILLENEYDFKFSAEQYQKACEVLGKEKIGDIAPPAAPTSPAPPDLAAEEQVAPILVCLDYDFTAADGHLHNTLYAGDLTPLEGNAEKKAIVFKGDITKEVAPERIKAITEAKAKASTKPITGTYTRKEIEGNGLRDGFVESIVNMIKDGHLVAITSYTHYPEGIQHELGAALKLKVENGEITQEQLKKQFTLVSGLPANQSSGKGAHMDAARQSFIDKGNEAAKDCPSMLVDDGGTNCTKAREVGVEVVEIHEGNPKKSGAIDKKFWKERVSDKAHEMGATEHKRQQELAQALAAEQARSEFSKGAEQKLEYGPREEAMLSVLLAQDKIYPNVSIREEGIVLMFDKKSDAKTYKQSSRGLLAEVSYIDIPITITEGVDEMLCLDATALSKPEGPLNAALADVGQHPQILETLLEKLQKDPDLAPTGSIEAAKSLIEEGVTLTEKALLAIKGIPDLSSITEAARKEEAKAVEVEAAGVEVEAAGVDLIPTPEPLALAAAARKSYIEKAVMSGKIEKVQFLLDEGADIQASYGIYEEKLLHIAVRSTPINTGMIIALINAGADINAQDTYKSTALIDAVCYKKPDAVEILIQQGADVKATDIYISSALHHAAKVKDAYFNQEIITKLIEAGADINAKDAQDRTPLMDAIRYKRTDEVKTLVAAGADVTAIDKEGKSVLHYAAKEGKDWMSQITESEQWKGLTASQRSAMANAKAGVDEQAPIHMAADIVSIDQLRAAGADVNAKDKKGKYPIQTVKEECQASLLAAHAGKSGAKKTKDFTGDHNANVSLLKAATNGDKADIEAALKDGASPRHISKDKKTPLHLVLESGNCTKKQKEEIVKKLIAAGADVNAKDPSGRTPLFMAAEAGMTEIVSELVKTPGIKVKEKASHKAKVETLAQDGVTTTTRLTGGVGNVGGSIAGRTAYKAVKAELKAAESYLAKEEKRIKAEGVKLKEGTAQGVQEKYDRIDNKKKIAAKRVAALKATQKVLEVPNREARLAYLAKKGKPKDIKTKLDTKDTAEARLNLEAALFAAVEHGNPDSLKVLLDHCKPPRGNDPPLGEMRNDKGQNLFDVAFENAKTAKVFTAKHRQCMMEIASAKQARGETEPLVSREKIAESLKPKGWFKSRSSLAKSLIEACGEALPSGLSTKDPSTGNLLLHDAILKGDKKATEMVIAQATKTHLEHMNEDGKTVLHVAAERGKKDFVKQLLAKVEKTTGMDAKKYVETPTKDEHKQNAIHLAAQAHKTNSKGERVEKDSKHELMRFLVKESRADVSLKDAHGKMPIDYALDDKHPHPKAAKKLLHYGSPNPNKGGITRIEEEMFKTRRGSIKELSKAKTSIAETKKLFEKIYPKEQYEHKYAEGKPKLLCMVVENGSDRAEDLIAKLTQPPYLNVNSPEKENFQDIKDAAQLAAKDGKQSLIDKMRNGISDQISMGQGTEAKNALLVAFDKAVVTGEVEKDRAERIAKLQAASTGVSSTAAARQAPRPSAARVLKPAGAAGANPEDATTAATIASTLAAARSSARGSSRSTNARRAVNPAQTLHLTDDGELDASVKEKFKDFLIHGIDNVDKRTNLQNTAIEKESASLIGNLLASGKVQNCEIAKETTSGAKGKIFEVTLADYRNKTLFFPKFDQDTGNQIMKDGKPVIEMLIIGDEGEIIGGTITNPSKNSSMP